MNYSNTLVAEDVSNLIPSPSGSNLALNKPAEQSSYSKWSKPIDARGAVNGCKTGRFGFHTSKEINPWWQVDLEAVCRISEIRIYNRMDACSDRIRTLKILISLDGRKWQQVYTNDRNNIFGGIDGNPLIVSIAAKKARYIRLQLNEENVLHLDEVEVYEFQTSKPDLILSLQFQTMQILNKLLLLNSAERPSNKSIYEKQQLELILKLEKSLQDLHKQQINARSDLKNIQKIIYHAQSGGLCNRLRTLCSCLALSDVLKIPLEICWLPSGNCNCYFEDLFEQSFATIDFENILTTFQNSFENSIYITNMTSFCNVLHKEYLEKLDIISLKDYEIKYLRSLEKLIVKTKIKEEIDRFISKNWTDNIVGIHVRRTDHTLHFSHNSNTAQKLSTDDKFFSKIDREISQGVSKFFLATDNSETQAIFKNRYPDRFITYCQEFHSSKARQTTIQDALIELYLLSRTKKLIGSNYSTFSIYAAELGNINLEFA
jgi:hypothetical protein